MTDLQAEKELVRRHYEAIASAQGVDIRSILRRHTTPDYLWYGMHPFNVLQGADAVADSFWHPIRRSFRNIQHRLDVFMAGRNQIDGERSTWVCSMGHLMGLFGHDWLGIPASHKMVFLRYAEFNRVEGDKIAETAMFCDILGIMLQVGLKPLPPQTGAFVIAPGPRTHDGLLYGYHDPKDGKITLKLVDRMIDGIAIAAKKNHTHISPAELSRCWHEDMIWWGPAGIGATYTIDRYIKQHSGPFRAHLADRKFNGHLSKIGEGNYCGFFGWPNLTLTSTGGYLGLPASDKPADMRVVDIYRREDDHLAENWVFIDILHFMKMQGLDVLARIKEFPRT